MARVARSRNEVHQIATRNLVEDMGTESGGRGEDQVPRIEFEEAETRNGYKYKLRDVMGAPNGGETYRILADRHVECGTKEVGGDGRVGRRRLAGGGRRGRGGVTDGRLESGGGAGRFWVRQQ